MNVLRVLRRNIRGTRRQCVHSVNLESIQGSKTAVAQSVPLENSAMDRIHVNLVGIMNGHLLVLRSAHYAVVYQWGLRTCVYALKTIYQHFRRQMSIVIKLTWMLEKRVGVAQTYLVPGVAQEKAHLVNGVHYIVGDPSVDILKMLVKKVDVNHALTLHVMVSMKGGLFAVQTVNSRVYHVRRRP